MLNELVANLSKNRLHITNGTVLTNYLIELDFEGEFLTWQEMLCEGPTTFDVGSSKFLDLRKNFLNKFYDIEIDEYEFKEELSKLKHTEKYDEIILWFEYDLFCHINLIAVISHIQRLRINLPLYLVCSGRVKGIKDFRGLAELDAELLFEHYKKKILLKRDDIYIAMSIWKLYCGNNHNLIKPYIVKTSSFKYLNSCLKAHLKRFPDSKTGLSRLEQHILETIKLNTIKSEHHLLGYVLNYQGYYGFGDLQIERMINKLSIFFNKTSKGLQLNRKGFEALIGQYNFSKEVDNNIMYGGISRLDFQFNKKQNKLIKTAINVN